MTLMRRVPKGLYTFGIFVAYYHLNSNRIRHIYLSRVWNQYRWTIVEWSTDWMIVLYSHSNMLNNSVSVKTSPIQLTTKLFQLVSSSTISPIEMTAWSNFNVVSLAPLLSCG